MFKNNYFHKKYFIYLFLVNLTIGLTFLQYIISSVKAEENNAPTIESVYISDTANGLVDDYSDGTITPNIGNSKTIHINGVVSDIDGGGDISSVNSVFYRSGIASAQDCTADNNNCYLNSYCTLSSLASTTKKYNCQIDLEYYIDATDSSGRYPAENWISYIKVLDISTASTTDSALAKEVASTLSLDIPGAISFGSFSLGSQTTQDNNYEMTIIQKGNSEADIMVSGSDMICSDIGLIEVEEQKWSLDDVGYSSASSTSLTENPTLVDILVDYRDDDQADMTKMMYWNIGIATSSVKGTCSGSSTFSVVLH